jgi:hypothetical protein
LARTSKVTGCGAIVATSSVAAIVDAALGALAVTWTVAVAVSPPGSFAVYVNASAPT